MTQQKCEDIQTLNKVFNNKRSPARKLCENCLQISPKNEMTFCNNCNLSHKTSSSTLLTNTEGTNVLEQNTRKCERNPIQIDFSSVCESPDVIPPTPPVRLKNLNKKKLGGNKCVKRKFNFVETDCQKKKVLCSEQSQPKVKEEPKIDFVYRNDENIPQGERKICKPSNKNPFLKSLTKSKNIIGSQATESLLDSVLAKSESPVQFSLVKSNLHKVSAVSSKTGSSRSEIKSTVYESVDLTSGDFLNSCREIRVSPQVEVSLKICENECHENSGGKSLQDHSSKSLKIDLVSHIDDKVLVEEPCPQKKILTSYARISDNQDLCSQGKTSGELYFPPISKPAEKFLTGPNVSDDEEISTSFLDDFCFDESTVKELVHFFCMFITLTNIISILYRKCFFYKVILNNFNNFISIA